MLRALVVFLWVAGATAHPIIRTLAGTDWVFTGDGGPARMLRSAASRVSPSTAPGISTSPILTIT
ncbi:MAG: hypothetical protein ACRD44_11610 [Bryobacteraceae bacterium]